jgi:hypothetical protein
MQDIPLKGDLSSRGTNRLLSGSPNADVSRFQFGVRSPRKLDASFADAISLAAHIGATR